MSETITDVYRCATCGHGRNLIAWFLGLAEGTVEGSALGEEVYGWEDTEIQEGSIACKIHGDTVEIHKRIGGLWCARVECGCGDGTVNDGYARTRTCPRCGGAGQPWRPTPETPEEL